MPFDSIDETRRKAFETAWREGRPEPIELFLPPEDSEQYLSTLEELVHIELEFRWKSWREVRHDVDTIEPGKSLTGETDGPALVEDYVNRFPPLDQPDIVQRLIKQEHLVRTRWGNAPAADEYLRRFPGILPPDWQPDSLASESGDFVTANFAHSGTAPSPRKNLAPRELPRTFGNYELLEEVGRGGMGVVYRGRQSTANRIVAVKVVRRDYLESLARDTQASALERFHQEILAAASLEHENIVPVYEVGDVDGEPFYSMKYVKGRSLADVVRDGPVPNREAAEYIVQVTRAITEAHRQEILHRDLKPQNILIDEPSGRALVVDFGLAKLLTNQEDLTQSGEVMGSPPYMSPEQARDASSVTGKTDTYAIGATLYHLLTGRPPFQAAHALVTLHQVMHQEAVPPRKLNPAIDRDLETICVKCLEKEPARRYESAEALADEIDRYLRNEPILARPVGALGRTSRWCRRNPVTATLIASSVTFLIMALVATTVGYARTTDALRREKTKVRELRQAMQRFYVFMSTDVLMKQPGVQPVRRKLLRQAHDYYTRLLDQQANDRSVQDETASAHFHLGRITEELYSPERALPHYRDALTIQQRLVANDPADRDHREALGKTHNAIGNALLKQGKWDAATAAYHEALKIREALVADEPEWAEYRRQFANSIMNLGVVEMERGRSDESLESYLRAQSIRQEILDKDPKHADTRRDLAMGCYNLGNFYRSQVPRDNDAAKASLVDAIHLFKEILRGERSDFDIEYRLNVARRSLADVEFFAKDHEAAEKLYDQALAFLEPLSIVNPGVPEYQAAVAHMILNLGVIYGDDGDFDAAKDALFDALTVFERLAEEYPDIPGYKLDIAITIREIAFLHIDLGEIKNAHKNLLTSEQHFQELVDQYPDDKEYARQLEETKRNLKELDMPIL
jgi:serine/threonine protein kinase/tetratricopeptide (TPR) repeat protein